jgi:hypothetical protein
MPRTSPGVKHNQVRDLDKTLVIQDSDKPLTALFEVRAFSGDAGADQG